MAKKNANFNVISTGSWVPSNINDIDSESKTYKIFINDLVYKAFIGIHQHEKNKKQKICISVILEVVESRKNLNDNIENVVSYEFIVLDIKKLLAQGHIGLLETLGEEIVKICFKDRRVLTAKVALQKMEVFKETRSVGIEVFRKRENPKIKNNSQNKK